MAINSPREIIQSQIATGNAESPVGAEIMSNAQGRSRATSEGVTVSSNLSDISDALEELGMARATRGKGDLDKMRARKGQGSNMEALARIKEYHDSLPDMPSDDKAREFKGQLSKYQELFQRFEQSGGHDRDLPTAEDIRKLLQDYDGDITHQFAILEQTRLELAQSGAPQRFLSVLDQIRADLRSGDAGQDVRAGFHAAREATVAGDMFAGSSEAYRDSYRQLVRAGGHMGKVFDALSDFATLGRRSRPEFEAVLDSFQTVAGADMSSFGPSTDPVILGDVIAELSVLKRLRSSLEMVDGLLENLGRMFPETADNLPDATQLTSLLLHFTAAAVASMMDAEKMMAALGADHPELAVVALNGLRDIHAKLPDAAMPSEGARLQQSQILTRLSDQVVQHEEDSYSGA